MRRNRANIGPGEGDWGFGQIVSLILILQCVVDVVVSIRNRCEGSTCDEKLKGNPIVEA